MDAAVNSQASKKSLMPLDRRGVGSPLRRLVGVSVKQLVNNAINHPQGLLVGPTQYTTIIDLPWSLSALPADIYGLELLRIEYQVRMFAFFMQDHDQIVIGDAVQTDMAVYHRTSPNVPRSDVIQGPACQPGHRRQAGGERALTPF